MPRDDSASITAFDATSLSPAKLPKNLILYTLALLDPSTEPFRQLSTQIPIWLRRERVESLAGYASVVDAVFDFLKESRLMRSSRPGVSKDIFDRLCEDIQALHDHLLDFLRQPEKYPELLTCTEDQSQHLLDLIQEMLDLFPDSAERPVLSKALLRISRASGLLPTCFPLSGLQKVGKQVAAGGFADIWRGLVRGQSVSVKIMRLFRDDDIRDILQTFGREALIWRQLSHPNVLPFFGLYYLDSRLCLVSPWMADGHVLDYLKTAPPNIDRTSLMLDIALGLEYLHENKVVHGDIKSMNILVTPSHRACVADFGLSSVTDVMTFKFPHSTASVRGGTQRYQAPELIGTENTSTFASDVYAFACVCYEIWTEQRPYFELKQDIFVAIKVCEGLRPSKPDNLADDHPLWMLLQDCWAKDAEARPTITQVVHRLVAEPIGATIRSYGSFDWDDSFSSRLRRSMQDWPLLPSVAKIEKRIFGRNSPVSPPATSVSATPLPPIKTLFAPARPKPRKSQLHSIYIPVSCITANHYVPILTTDPLVEVFVSTHDLEVHRIGPAHNLPSLPQMRSVASSPVSSPVDESSHFQAHNPLPRPPQSPQLPDLETLQRQYLEQLSRPARTPTPRTDRMPFLTSPHLGGAALPRVATPDLDGKTVVSNAPLAEFPATPLLGFKSRPSALYSDPLIDPTDHWVDTDAISSSSSSFSSSSYSYSASKRRGLALASVALPPPETPSLFADADSDMEAPSSDSPLIIRGPSLSLRRKVRVEQAMALGRRPAKRRKTEPLLPLRYLLD
uniref:Protein kinase domain-containing protein n=1 Tax=Mycena chlorophos TaxID=658473 RepID=A0ABQ0LJI2_MYCCL|nr:predicted protein [Mycena chlorophos]